MTTQLNPNVQSLQNKTVVVTGATSGVGRAAAIEFAKYKTNLVLAARSTQALQQVEKECRDFGADIIIVQTDTSNAEAVNNLAAAAHAFKNRIDVWVNNAGVLAAGEFTETPLEVHHRVIQTNLIGYMNGAYAVLPYFKQQQYGILINNISVGAWMAVPYAAAYSASKFGLLGLMRALQGEYIKFKHIHICNLFPAFLDTPGLQHAANYTGKVLHVPPPLYDPQRVARRMIKLAVHPKNSALIGSEAYLVKLSQLIPNTAKFFMAKMMETYFKQADDISLTSGNLFEPVEYGTSIYGGWNTKTDARHRKKIAIRIGVIAGIIAGAGMLANNKRP